jgi:hypothetical protein
MPCRRAAVWCERKLWTTNGSLGEESKLWTKAATNLQLESALSRPFSPKTGPTLVKLFFLNLALNSKLQPMGRWYHAACDSLGVKENYGQLNGSLVIKEYYGQQMAAWV